MASLRKKLSYSIGANIVSLLISVFTSIGIPKLMAEDVGGYGYFQIFVFYAGYIGFLHFGYCDGIILRVAGKKYGELDKRLYSGELKVLTIFEALIGILIALTGTVFSNDPAYRFIWLLIGFNTVIIIPKFMLLDILQVTAKVREYAIVTTMGRVSFLAGIVLCMVFGFRQFEYFVLAQTMGELMAFGAALWFCRDIVVQKALPIRECLVDMKLSIFAGYKLLVSNIAVLLFAGIPRMFIQGQYDTTVYGKVSFAFVISNMVLTFISAVEIVLYPEFKRKTQDNLEYIFNKIDGRLMSLFFTGIAFYYPFYLVMERFLPRYTDALVYMVYLFPLCAYSSKMNLLVQNDMKVFRMEKEIMKVNVVTVLMSLGFTILSLFLEDSLKWMMVFTTVVYMFRCVYAEIVLNNKIKVFSVRNEVYDALITAAFILCMGFFTGWKATGAYAAILVIYLFLRNHGKAKEKDRL